MTEATALPKTDDRLPTDLRWGKIFYNFMQAKNGSLYLSSQQRQQAHDYAAWCRREGRNP